jgi:hypothetical protein
LENILLYSFHEDMKRGRGGERERERERERLWILLMNVYDLFDEGDQL